MEEILASINTIIEQLDLEYVQHKGNKIYRHQYFVLNKPKKNLFGLWYSLLLLLLLLLLTITTTVTVPLLITSY